MNVLSYHKATRLLSHYKLPFARSHLCTELAQAKKFATKIGFPVVAKLISSHCTHKTDVGGVVTQICSETALTKAWQALTKIDPEYEGVLIQEQCSGAEGFAGLHNDPTFGMVVGFGTGGILVEKQNDVHFGIVPIKKRDAERMLRKARIGAVLAGYRGHKNQREAMCKILLTLSQIGLDHPDISLDLNPIFIERKRIVVADWRVLVE